MKTIQDILISRNELERLYLGHTTLHLWRAVQKGMDVKETLQPALEKKDLGRGRVRQPDVETYARNGEQWVRSVLGMGVSLFDRSNAFPGGGWEYFLIPAGTVIPAGLAITKDHYIDRYSATHYSVSPSHDMPASMYRRLLDELAFNARHQSKVSANG
jgi:hypothetical protein